ncbi:MAG: serine/threonine protein kinase [Candidatus Rokuibacteriota bacterium]
MATQMGGLPYWQMRFDEAGKPQARLRQTLLRELPQQGIRHLFVFSHGWNNSPAIAESLYGRFFTQLTDVLRGRGIARGGFGAVGIIWPSIRWVDEGPPSRAGGAAAAGKRGAAKSDGDLIRDLKTIFTTGKQRKALDQMAQMLDKRPSGSKEIARFQRLMQELAPHKLPAEDDGERALLKKKPEVVFGAMASLASRQRRRAAAGVVDDLWDGAKEALRATTYWQMKERAGVVGKAGLGPLVADIHQATPDARIHLLGHSFGARLVSFSLAGLPSKAVGAASPVKSLVLLQGAFSHFAFADALPHDTKRGGALKGMASRVDGPILVTHSRKDSAVGSAYPKASFLSRDDAAAADARVPRWGAMGSAGAQAVNATELPFADVGDSYSFSRGRFFNLDGNTVIVDGGPPSGAHSDIVHDKIAWAVICGAGAA